MVVTIKHIAKKAGVDISVVSRVLNNRGDEYRISKQRQSKVRKIAKSLSYSPNLSAQAIRTGRFGCAALLLSSYKDRSFLPHLVLDGIHDELEKHDLHLLLTKLPDERPDDLSSLPKVFRTLMADGLIVNYVRELSPCLASLIEQNESPTVWVNVKKEQDCIYSDSYRASHTATEKLIDLGHKRIAYFDFHHPDINKSGIHYSARDRFFGYRDAMSRADLKPCDVRREEIDYIVKVLSQPDRPTAFVSYWSTGVPILLRAIRMAGLTVPNDISLITMAGQSNLDELCASAMIEPDHDMGREAARMLIKKTQDCNTIAMPSKVLQFSYVDFGTCVPLNKG